MSSTMFKAVVWKELRENLKYAVVVLIGMSAVLAVLIPSVDDLLRGQGVDLNWISNAFEPATVIGGLLAGLLLGAAQTLVENRGDKWGFLAHRPISRTTLFWGKATAGILLYVISTGVPVAAALLWIASPGYLPIPFDWRIALPAIANLLCGLVFYFAGILTGMRQARWYASRTLGIGAALGCLVLQQAAAAEFWQAVAANAAGLLLVGTAAWSTFVAGGQYGAQPMIGRIATGAAIGLGMMIVGWVALVISLIGFPGYVPPLNASFYSYVVTTEGMVVRVTFADNRIAEVSDPDGRPLEQYRNLARGQVLSADVATARLSPRPWALPSFRSTSRFFSQLRRANAASPVSWYYLHRLRLLAAYDARSRKQIGWIGPDGFSPGETRPRAFAGRLVRGTQNLLVLEDAVYRLDLDRLHVERAFQAAPAETVLDAGSPQYSNTSTLASFGELAQFEVISTTRRVLVLRRDGTILIDAPQDANAREFPSLLVSRPLQAPGSPTFLWHQDNAGGESRISEYNGAGELVNSRTLPATSDPPQALLSHVALSSAIFPLFGQSSFDNLGGPRRFESSMPRPAETARWAVAILSSLVSAAAVFLRGRRYAFTSGRLGTWMVIALLLGPLGFLTMLALVEWPARESCPSCSRKRVVTRERCEHCGEPFAAPPQDGTEIFEPVPASWSDGVLNLKR